VGFESMHRSDLSVNPYRARSTSRNRPAGPALGKFQPLFSEKLCIKQITPEMTTSYFSSVPLGSNFGERRGKGGANEGRTRKSREEVEYSVKTGIVKGRFSRFKDVEVASNEDSKLQPNQLLYQYYGGNSLDAAILKSITHNSVKLEMFDWCFPHS
jgi:hypothetical protein